MTYTSLKDFGGSMAEQNADRKAGTAFDGLEHFSIESARPVLGDLVHRAGVLDERTVITRNGRPSAAVVSIADLERLLALDAAAANAA